MFSFLRQSTQQLRPWLIAAAAMVLLVSILEASHTHGVFTEVNDNCTLCQHSVTLDKVLSSCISIVIPPLLALATIAYVETFFSRPESYFSLIRAPPALIHTR